MERNVDMTNFLALSISGMILANFAQTSQQLYEHAGRRNPKNESRSPVSTRGSPKCVEAGQKQERKKPKPTHAQIKSLVVIGFALHYLKPRLSGMRRLNGLLMEF